MKLFQGLVLIAFLAESGNLSIAGQPTNSLSLESEECVGEEGAQIQVKLWLRNPLQPVTGFQAFIQFDPAVLTFLGGPSCYTKCSGAVDPPCDRGPFQLQFPSNIASAGTFPGAMPGQLNISGSTAPVGACAAPATSEALIATFVFQVNAGQTCMTTVVSFRPYGNLESELSFQGVPIQTSLTSTPVLVFDQSPPNIACPPDQTITCEDSTDPAKLGFAMGNDVCSAVAIDFEDSITQGPSPAEYTVLRTWSAVDACGLVATCLQTIDVIPSGPDTDSDGVLDCVDNCQQVQNPDQSDCDANGIGNACDDSPPPMIQEQPLPRSACSGAAAFFMVAATGSEPLSYQWRRDGDALVNGVEISGAQTSMLTISNVESADAGDYDCLITDACGESISAPAELAVFPTGSGDPSGDMLVNGLDVQGMTDALLSGGPASGSYCACDLTGDGVADESDVEPFVTLLLVK